MLSFVLKPSGSPSPKSPIRSTVLVTGAAGNIGSYFAEHYHTLYNLRLMIRPGSEPPPRLETCGEIVEADLSDCHALRAHCEGADTVLHLAGEPSPSAVWDDLLTGNIVGTYNLFTAAKAAGCKKVIYASSIHAVSGYPADVQVKTTDPVNPGDLYGVSKCFGEALGRYFACQEGLHVIALRIGGFQPVEYAKKAEGLAMMDAWVSRWDLAKLLHLCIDDERLQFAILNGLSDNRFKRLDMTEAMELLGFRPEHDFTELNPETAGLNFDRRVLSHNVSDAGQESGLRADLPKE
jgi:thioester reductase-like protein